MNVALHSDNSLNVISLCTGGGGLDLGVELAIPCTRPVVLVEREAFSVARLVSAMEEGLMAPAPVWSDVRTFNGRPWRGLVDGLIGGIPCQPHSFAGKRLGADDERDLWSDTRRIIVQSGAWFVLIENVQGMLSTGGAKRVWRDLRRLGFEVEIGLFTSAEVGAPHERTRVFILAVADSTISRSGRIPIFERGQDEAYCNADRGRTVLPDAISRGHDGIAEDTIRRQIERNAPEWSERDYLPLYPPGPGDLNAWRDIAKTNLEFVPALSAYDRFRIACRNAGIDPPRHSCGKAGRAPSVHKKIIQEIADANLRRVADGMAERLDQLRMLGNGVNPLQAAYAVRTLATRLARRSAAADILVRMMEFET